MPLPLVLGVVGAAIALVCALELRHTAPRRHQDPSAQQSSSTGQFGLAGSPASGAHRDSAMAPRTIRTDSPAGAKNAAPPTISDLERALASGDPVERENALTKLLPALVSQDAQAAARFAELYAAPELREQLLRRVSHLWAARDVASAMEWARTLSDAGERDAAVTDICAQAALTDPAQAVQLRVQYAPVAEPDVALENLTQQWAARDFAAALEWVMARPQGTQRDLLLARIAFIQSRTAPSDAASLIIEHMAASETQTEAVLTVLHQWAVSDRAAAAEWVDEIPQGTMRQRAREELATLAPPTG